MARGFSLHIFLPDGAADGLRLVEKSNWTGHGLFCPRPLYPEMRGRVEFQRTGIYLLLGAPSDGELVGAYIGEGDPIGPRLDSHQAARDFWITAIGFTSKDANLNKAHVQHLESRLVALATGAKRCKLENGNTPQPPTLSEADAAYAETFLDEILLCLPTLGVTIFEQPRAAATVASVLSLDIAGVRATGYEAAAGFVVLAGSEVRRQEVPSLQQFVRDQRAALLDNGVVVVSGAGTHFAQDYEFGSPSGAASFILAAPANGRTAWKDAAGRTLKEIQENV